MVIRLRTSNPRTKPRNTMKTNSKHINGIDTEALGNAAQAIANDASQGQTKWLVSSHWKGGTRSDAKVSEYHLAGQRIARNFTISIDEPLELCGANQYANPQEYLLAALNACMIVGYTALCSLQGITIDELVIETKGDIDLRGFLGLNPTVKPGYDGLRYTVHLKGSGTPEQFEEIHRKVMATSPNYFNIANAIPLQSQLVIGSLAEKHAA